MYHTRLLLTGLLALTLIACGQTDEQRIQTQVATALVGTQVAQDAINTAVAATMGTQGSPTVEPTVPPTAAPAQPAPVKPQPTAIPA